MANYNNILYLFDDNAKAPEDWPPGSRVIVVPITSDYEWINSIVEKVSENNQAIEVVNYVEIFHAKAFELRDPFLKFTADLSGEPRFNGKSLKETLADRRRTFSLWWLTPVAEKNTVVSGAYARLTALAAISDIMRRHNCDELRLDISDPQLSEGLRSNAAAFGIRISDIGSRRDWPSLQAGRAFARSVVHIGKICVKMIQAKWTMRRTRPFAAMEKARYLLVTYFPLFDKESWASGQWLNKYYAPVQRELEKKYPGQVAWLALYTRLDGFSWRQSLDLGRRVVAQGNSLSFFEQWLGLADIAAIIAGAFGAAVKFARLRGTLSKGYIFNHDGFEFNIWPLFKNDWYESFYGPGLIKGLVNYRVCRNVLSRVSPQTTVLYIAEMLAWEKALNIAAGEHEGLKVVGIQHTIVPLLFLNYFNHKTELRSNNNISDMPRPDYLACVGRTPLKLFLDSGWDPKKVFLLGAIRFQHFKSYMNEPVDWQARENKIVIALSISPIEGQAILRLAYRAFKSKVGYDVVIKGHPGCPVAPLIEAAGLEFDRDIFTFSDKFLPELLPKAKALVVAESSAALEAIAYRCPVIAPRLPGLLDLNPLTGLTDLPSYVSDPGELRRLADQIIARRESPLSDADCRSFIEDYCYFPETESEFLKKIENLTFVNEKAVVV